MGRDLRGQENERRAVLQIEKSLVLNFNTLLKYLLQSNLEITKYVC